MDEQKERVRYLLDRGFSIRTYRINQSSRKHYKDDGYITMHGRHVLSIIKDFDEFWTTIRGHRRFMISEIPLDYFPLPGNATKRAEN